MSVQSFGDLSVGLHSKNLITNKTTFNLTTSENYTWPQRDDRLATIEVAVQSSIFILTLVGNGVVLCILAAMARRKDLGRMYTLIGHLSFSDLFVALFQLLPQLAWDVTYRFQGGNMLCKAVKFTQVMAMYASAYVLVATAVDRFMAICYPMKCHHWTSKTAHKLALFSWCLAALFSVPQLFIFSYREVIANSQVYDCLEMLQTSWLITVYVTWFAIVVYIGPLLLLCFVYTRICRVVWKSARVSGLSNNLEPIMSQPTHPTQSTQPTQPTAYLLSSVRSKRNQKKTAVFSPSNPSLKNSYFRRNNFVSTPKYINKYPVHLSTLNSCTNIATNTMKLCEMNDRSEMPDRIVNLPPAQNISRAKTRTVKLTLAVVAGYLICWAPFFIAQMWWAFDVNAPFENSAMVIILLLASLNSCINPWIYLTFSDQLRRRALHFCVKDNHKRVGTLSGDSMTSRWSATTGGSLIDRLRRGRINN